MTEKITSPEDFQISCALKGLLWSFIITIVLAIISGLLLQYSPLSENLLSGFSTFIFFISMFLGSTIAARAAERKGLQYGTAVSLTYFILTLIIGLLLDSSLITFNFILKRTALTASSALLGGIIGVGLVTK